MTIKAYAFWLYGMFGPLTDPGSRVMSERIQKELGYQIVGSPYRDYDVDKIVEIILSLPATAPVLVGGVSLGCNNTPVVASYVYQKNPRRLIHGIWGFQASNYGEQAEHHNYGYDGIPPNVLFAHLTRSDTIIPVPGIGAYRWIKSPNNLITNLHIETVDDVHPGDGNVTVQNEYLAEMKRVVAAASK